MNTIVPVKNRKEGRLIRRALEDPTVRAFVLVMGSLMDLPTDRARARVLNHVADFFDEENARAQLVADCAVDPVVRA
jgi:hypothetical protein